MPMSVTRRLICAGVAFAALAAATPAWAETKPPTAPSPRASKWEGRDFDATKSRTPAKPKSWYTLPEKDDEVLLRSRRKGQ